MNKLFKERSLFSTSLLWH